MIKEWASEKFFSIQNIAQQMKTMIRDRKIWVKAVENQKAEIVNSFMYEFKNKKKIWKKFSQIVSCWFLSYSETSMNSESSNQKK